MLTIEQLQILKATIDADPVLAAHPLTPDGAWEIAEAFNAPSSPSFTVWKTFIEAEEIMSNGFVWTAVDALSVGKARIWDWMTRYGSINPSKVNVRQGLADCFGAGSPMANVILPQCKRIATKAEALFATGTGSDASPGNMTFEGVLTYREVQQARVM